MTTPMVATTTSEFETMPGDLNQGKRRAGNRSIRGAFMQWLVAHENNKREIMNLRRAQQNTTYTDDVAGPSCSEIHQTLTDVLSVEEDANYYSNQYLRILDFFGRRQGITRNPDESIDHYGERVLGQYHGHCKGPSRWPYYFTVVLLTILLLAALAFLITGVKRLYTNDSPDFGYIALRGGILFGLSVLLAIIVAWALAYLLSRYPRRDANFNDNSGFGHRRRGHRHGIDGDDY